MRGALHPAVRVLTSGARLHERLVGDKGDRVTADLCKRIIAEEYEKLRKAGNRDVHDVSKNTTLPIAREIVETYIMDEMKLPWYVDLLNINLNNFDLTEAKRRIKLLTEAYRKDGTRITENLDFDSREARAR